MTGGLRLRYALVCEDVRREETGKLILIGVFGGDLRTTRWPLNLSLSLVAEISSDEPIDVPIGFRCVGGDGDAVLSEIKGRMNADEPGRALLPVPGFVIKNITAETTLKFQWRTGDADWETIYTLPIIYQEAPSPSNAP